MPELMALLRRKCGVWCVCVYGHVPATTCIQRSYLWESVLSYHTEPRDQAQVVRLDLLSHLLVPPVSFQPAYKMAGFLLALIHPKFVLTLPSSSLCPTPHCTFLPLSSLPAFYHMHSITLPNPSLSLFCSPSLVLFLLP